MGAGCYDIGVRDDLLRVGNVLPHVGIGPG